MEVPGRLLGYYGYWFWSRHVGALVAVLFLIMALVFPTVMALALGKNSDTFLVVTDFDWWVIWGGLIALCFWQEKRFTTILQPVTLTDQGIATDLRGDIRELLFPRRNPGFISWRDVDRVEFIHAPDSDAQFWQINKWTIRIIAQSRKIVIYGHIQRYDELRGIIEEQMRRHGKPLNVPAFNPVAIT